MDYKKAMDLFFGQFHSFHWKSFNIWKSQEVFFGQWKISSLRSDQSRLFGRISLVSYYGKPCLSLKISGNFSSLNSLFLYIRQESVHLFSILSFWESRLYKEYGLSIETKILIRSKNSIHPLEIWSEYYNENINPIRIVEE